MNQVAVKVAPALAAGCTMVLKPSEIAPFDAMIFAEVLHAAGVPAGVFNLVNGDGPGVGTALSQHPDVAMDFFYRINARRRRRRSKRRPDGQACGAGAWREIRKYTA